MFCGKCGTKNEEDAVICVACGEQINDSGEAGSEAANLVNSLVTANHKNKKIGMLAVAGVVILVFVIATSLFGGKNYEKTALKFVKAGCEADAKTMVKLFPPEIQDMLEEMYGGRKEMIQSLDEVLNQSKDVNQKISYKILDSEDLPKKDLKNLKESYEKELDTVLSDAKYVEIEAAYKYDGKEESETFDICVIKIKGSWYVDVSSLY